MTTVPEYLVVCTMCRKDHERLKWAFVAVLFLVWQGYSENTHRTHDKRFMHATLAASVNSRGEMGKGFDREKMCAEYCDGGRGAPSYGWTGSGDKAADLTEVPPTPHAAGLPAPPPPPRPALGRFKRHAASGLSGKELRNQIFQLARVKSARNIGLDKVEGSPVGGASGRGSTLPYEFEAPILEELGRVLWYTRLGNQSIALGPNHCSWREVICGARRIPVDKIAEDMRDPSLAEKLRKTDPTYETITDNVQRLVVMELRMNQLTLGGKWPENFNKLQYLITIDMTSMNFNGNVPENIFVPSASFVRIVASSISELPARIGSMTKLHDLDVARNHLREIPDVLFTLPALKLNFDKNFLTALPPSFSNASTLQHLTLRDNSVSDLPPLPVNIREFYATKNAIHGDLSQLCGAPYLNAVEIDHNKLKSISPCLFELESLRYLSAQNNAIEKLPSSIRSAKKLGKLFLSHNSIERVPEMPLELHNLDIGENPIGDLPEHIFGNSKLKLLTASGVGMVTLSESIGNLKNLETLKLAKNGLRELPHSMSKLHNLLSLAVQDNDLSSISLEGMPRLRFLHMMHNPRLGVNHATFEKASLTVLRMGLESLPSLARFILGPKGVWEKGDLQLPRERGQRPTSIPEAIAMADEGKLTQFKSGKVHEIGFYHCRNIQVIARGAFYITLRSCRCRNGAYGVYPEGLVHECHPCMAHAFCIDDKAHCVEGFYFPDLYANQTVHATAKEEHDESTDGDGQKCAQCPEGAHCHDNIVEPKKGFWRPSENDVNVYQCKRECACQGGKNSTCSDGYAGRLCSECLPGYYEQAGRCKECPDLASNILWGLALLVGPLFLVFTLILLADMHEKTSNLYKQMVGKGNFDIDAVALQGPEQALIASKSAISFLQVLGVIDYVYIAEFPEIFSKMAYYLQWLSLDFLSPGSIECLVESAGNFDANSPGYSAYHQLIYTTVFPLMIVFGVGLLIVVSVALAKLCKYPVSWSIITRLNMRLAILVSLLFYLPISSKAVQVFRCRTFDGGNTYYLDSDLSLECFNDEWVWFAYISGTILVLYSVGFPAFLFGLAVWFAQTAHKTKSVNMLRRGVWFVISPFKKKYAYWESVELMRRFMIGALAMHFSSSPAFQIFIALVLSFAFIILHLMAQPFKSSNLNFVHGAQLVMVYWTLTIGLLPFLQVPSHFASPIIFLILACNLTLVSLTVALVMWSTATMVYQKICSFIESRKNRRVSVMYPDQSAPLKSNDSV